MGPRATFPCAVYLLGAWLAPEVLFRNGLRPLHLATQWCQHSFNDARVEGSIVRNIIGGYTALEFVAKIDLEAIGMKFMCGESKDHLTTI